MKPHLPEHIELSFCPFYPRFWGFERWLRKQPRAIYILLYKVGYEFSPEQVQRLRDKAIAVGVDHKDGDLSKVDLSLFDFHISASESGRKALDQLLAERAPEAARRPFTDVLYQSPDTRLNGLTPRELDRLSTVYLGLRSNSSIPPEIAGEIDVIEILQGSDMAATIEKMPNYNFHYAVRPGDGSALLRRYKPFTKGVTAAACGSNILVNKDADDAIDFLTADYPYLIEDNQTPTIVEAFRRAGEDRGGAEWNRGLEIMRSVKERVSGRALAAQLTRIVDKAAI